MQRSLKPGSDKIDLQVEKGRVPRLLKYFPQIKILETVPLIEWGVSLGEMPAQRGKSCLKNGCNAEESRVAGRRESKE